MGGNIRGFLFFFFKGLIFTGVIAFFFFPSYHLSSSLCLYKINDV